MSFQRLCLVSFAIYTLTNSEKWVGNVISETLLGLNLRPTVGKCAEDLEYYRKHLQNNSVWAVKMSESSAGSISGIMSGNIYQLGHFDQCTSVNVPEINLRGKYCVVQFRYWPNTTLFPEFNNNRMTISKEPSNFDSVWHALKVTDDMRFQRRDILYLGFCLPSSCSSRVIQDSIEQEGLPKFHEGNIDFEILTSEKHCSENEGSAQETQYGLYTYFGIMIMLVIFVTIGTTLQIYNESKGDYEGRYYYSLSIIFNMQKLLNNSSNELGPASGLKVLSMFIVIYGHRYLLSLYGPVINMNENEQRYGQFWETYVLNGNIVVNTFFCTTGYITFYNILGAIETKKSFSYFGSFTYRWIRITVVYSLIIFFMATVLKHVGKGPLWKNVAGERAEVCNHFWWAHLLYINNYFFTDKLCLIPAWYLACDMQLFVLALFIGFIYGQKSKFGKALLLFLLFISVIIIPGFATYFGNFSGTAIFYIRNIAEFHLDRDYINTYITTHFRLSPYMIGMAAAVFHKKLKRNSFKIPFWIHVLLAFSTVLFTGISLLGAWQFYLPEENKNLLQSAFYAVYSKFLWSINMCWFIMANATGGEELLTTRLLSSRIFAILNKLNLSVLLVHTPLQFILVMTLRTPQYVSHFTIIWMAFGDILLSYIISLLIYLLIEAPISTLCKKILMK